MSDVLASKLPSSSIRTLSPFEFWPSWLFYTPVVLHWIYLGIRYQGLSLATAANPCIESGGLCGESKSSILDQVGSNHRAYIADYIKVTIGTDSVGETVAHLARRAIRFPIVVKPDIGCHGNGVRLANNVSSLKSILRHFRSGVQVLLQEYIPYEGEAGVFYVRVPGQEARITSLTLKHAPFVEGDGRSTLRQLILADPRTREIAYLYYPRLGDKLDQVIPAREPFRLVFTGNHCKGSVFRDGRAEITLSLTKRVDEICQSLPKFNFGRIDLRFRDLSSLRRGQDFRIIEINGVGSEATHIWDPRTTLKDAYRAQFEHYGLAFKIGDLMRKSGHRPTALRELFGLWRRQNRLMSSYPMND